MKKLSVNPAAKTSKKHASRKLKSSWRKNIDTTDVDNFLEEKRQDERIGGTLEDKQNIELFTEDAKPGRGKLTLRELRKKKFTEAPTFALPLKNTSQVKDPIVKRNIKIKKIETPAVSVPRAVTARKSTRKTAQKPDVFQKDLWADDEKMPEELRSEWMGKEQLLHTMKNVGKPVVLKLPGKMDTADRIAAEAKKLPREGTSYNPAIDDYVELKNEVVEQEKQIIKRKAHFDRVVTKMFTKMTPEEKDRVYRQEMSEAVNKAEHSEQEDEESAATVVKVAVGKRRKRGSKTKKREHHKKLYEAKKLKDELAKLKEINRIEEITEEVQEMEEKAEEKALKKSSKGPATDNLPIDFIEPDLLAGSLRTIQPLNNLIATGLPKVRKISIFKNSRAEIQRKKSRPNKKVSYIRRSHKIGDA